VCLNGERLTRFPPIRFRPGDVLALDLPGAGGFGPLDDREAERVRADVELGYVSAAAALTDYGIDVLA
jgi:N-methylhydantoinase B